jgi:hypothetical protein
MLFVKIFLLLLLRIAEGVLSIFLTVTFVLPALAVLYFFNSLSRAIVSIHLWLKYRGTVRLTNNGLDNIWGYRPPGGGNCRNVLFVATYGHKIDGLRYRSKFLSDVINFTAPDGSRPYEKLKQIFVKKCGYYCWEDDTNFDIANHILVYPDDKLVTEAQLMDILRELSADMNETHPQWQEIIIPNFQYDPSSSVIKENQSLGIQEQSLRILRFHHSYGKVTLQLKVFVAVY